MEELRNIGGLAQLGSFGLLCYIAIWLMKWVPKRMERADAVQEKEAEIKAKVAERDAESREKVAEALRKTVESQATSYIDATNKTLEAFAEQNRYEREECERRHQELLARVLENHNVIREVRHEVLNIAQARAMEKAARELQDSRVADPAKGRPKKEPDSA